MKLWLSFLIAITASEVMARSLTVSTPDWPPFFIHDAPAGRGMGWEILAQCGQEIDKHLVFDMFPIRRMFKQMEDGSLDVNIMSFKEDRTKIVAYGKEVVFANTYGVWVGAHVNQEIRRLTDLDNLSIGQLVGLRPSDQFRDYFDKRMKKNGNKESIELNDPDQVIKMLASQRIDAAIISSPEIRWRSKKLGLQNKIKDAKYSVKSQDYFFVVSRQSSFFKKDPDLIRKLDTCVKTMKLSGRWHTLKTRYEL